MPFGHTIHADGAASVFETSRPTDTWTVPEGRLKAHLEDLTHSYDLPASDHPLFNAILTGQAKHLGRGHEANVYKVESYAIKVASVTPFQVSNTAQFRTLEEAGARLTNEVAVTNAMRAKGVTGIPEWSLHTHSGRTFAVRNYLEEPKALGRFALDALQRTVLQMHAAGYAVDGCEPQFQIGLDEQNLPVLYDHGFTQPCIGQNQEYRKREDVYRLMRTYNTHGHPFLPLGGHASLIAFESRCGMIEALKARNEASKPAFLKLMRDELRNAVLTMRLEHLPNHLETWADLLSQHNQARKMVEQASSTSSMSPNP